MNNQDGSIYLGMLVAILSCSLLMISTSFVIQRINHQQYLYEKHKWEAYWLGKEVLDLWKKGSTKSGSDERFQIQEEDFMLTEGLMARRCKISWRENDGLKEMFLIGYKAVLPSSNVPSE